MENKIFVWSDDDMQEFAEQYRFLSSRISLEMYKKSKEVKKDYLFTTEDGVEKFKGDRSNFVDTKTWELSSWSYMPCPLIIKSKGNCETDFSHYKFFESTDKAKEYILMNKPCLSIKDLLDNNFIYGCMDNTMKSLKDLVKSKLYNVNPNCWKVYDKKNKQ